MWMSVKNFKSLAGDYVQAPTFFSPRWTGSAEEAPAELLGVWLDHEQTMPVYLAIWDRGSQREIFLVPRIFQRPSVSCRALEDGRSLPLSSRGTVTKFEVE